MTQPIGWSVFADVTRNVGVTIAKVSVSAVLVTTAVVGGTALSLVPVIGPAAGGAVVGGTGNLVRQLWVNDEVDTDELGDAISNGTHEGWKMGANNSYDGPPSVFYPPAEYLQ